MLNILVVDDFPKLKTDAALQYLKHVSKIEFSCEYFTDVNSAKRYIKTHKNDTHLIILDLGLPIIQGGDLDALNGLDLITFMHWHKIQIPVIINSTTSIPDEAELIEMLQEDGFLVRHVETLNPEWLAHFIQFELPNSTNLL